MSHCQFPTRIDCNPSNHDDWDIKWWTFCGKPTEHFLISEGSLETYLGVADARNPHRAPLDYRSGPYWLCLEHWMGHKQ